MRVDLLELNRRGGEDFDGLSEVEKDLYSLLVLALLSEMEGFEHCFFTDHNARIPRVISLLDAASSPNVRPVREMHDWIERELATRDPAHVEEFILRERHSTIVDCWGKDFLEGLQPMWAAVASYLKDGRGVEIVDGASPSASLEDEGQPGPGA